MKNKSEVYTVQFRRAGTFFPIILKEVIARSPLEAIFNAHLLFPEIERSTIVPINAFPKKEGAEIEHSRDRPGR